MGYLGRFLFFILIFELHLPASAKAFSQPFDPSRDEPTVKTVTDASAPTPTETSEALPFETFFHDFTDHTLFQESNNLTRDQWLTLLKKGYPELKIVVLELPAPQFPDVFPLEFRDSSVSPSTQEYYHQYSLTMVQNVAFYAAPGAAVNDDLGRPEIHSPLLVLRENTPFHALMHEVGHFLTDHEQRNFLEENSLPTSHNERLAQIISGVAEESFVDALLLTQADSFSWKLDEACPRHRYLSQNNQVLKFHLQELRKNAKDHSTVDKTVITEISKLYNWTRRLQNQWHTECFLWSFRN